MLSSSLGQSFIHRSPPLLNKFPPSSIVQLVTHLLPVYVNALFVLHDVHFDAAISHVKQSANTVLHFTHILFNKYSSDKHFVTQLIPSEP